MLSLSVNEACVKSFMNRLLREGLFDAFETRAVELAARVRVSVNGALENESGFVKWAELKPLVTEMIKSGGKPKYLKIVFAADSGVVSSVHQNAQALFLNLSYENNGVTFTTASAQKQFELDKSLDAQWDAYVRDFFISNNVEAEVRA